MQLLKKIADFIASHIKELTALVAPSIGVFLLKVIGFASSIPPGSLAAVLQSAFWKGSTSGVFSILQSIGATSSVAAPPVIGLGVACAIGIGIWQRK